MCQFGSEKDFSETLKWLDDHSVPTDTRTFNILLNRATRKNDMKWADDLFRRMITNRMKPSGDVVRNLVNLYIRNQHGMGIEEVSVAFELVKLYLMWCLSYSLFPKVG